MIYQQIVCCAGILHWLHYRPYCFYTSSSSLPKSLGKWLLILGSSYLYIMFALHYSDSSLYRLKWFIKSFSSAIIWVNTSWIWDVFANERIYWAIDHLILLHLGLRICHVAFSRLLCYFQTHITWNYFHAYKKVI